MDRVPAERDDHMIEAERHLGRAVLLVALALWMFGVAVWAWLELL